LWLKENPIGPTRGAPPDLAHEASAVPVRPIVAKLRLDTVHHLVAMDPNLNFYSPNA
jgi:hypothetical protein